MIHSRAVAPPGYGVIRNPLTVPPRVWIGARSIEGDTVLTIIAINGRYFDHVRGEMKGSEREAWYRMGEAIGLTRADVRFVEYHPSTKGQLHARRIRRAIAARVGGAA